MINDVRIFKSELKLYKHYQTVLKNQKNLLELTYNTYTSPLSYEEGLIFENGKFKKVNVIKQHSNISTEQRIEIEQRVEKERIRLNRMIEKYSSKIKEIDETLRMLPNDLRNIVVEIYINNQSIKSVSKKHNYSKEGLYKKINNELLKYIEK